MSGIPATVYKITIEAYGRTDVIHFMGSHGHHKVPFVQEQMEDDGRLIHRTLDEMWDKRDTQQFPDRRS